MAFERRNASTTASTNNQSQGAIATYLKESSMWKNMNIDKTEAVTLGVGIREKEGRKEVYIKISQLVKTGTEWKAEHTLVPMSKWNVMKLKKYLEICEPVVGRELTEEDDCIIRLVNATTKSGVVLNVYCEPVDKGGKIVMLNAITYEAGEVITERLFMLENIVDCFHEKVNTDIEELISALIYAYGEAQFTSSNGNGAEKKKVEERKKLLGGSNRRMTPAVDGGNNEGTTEVANEEVPKRNIAGLGRNNPPVDAGKNVSASEVVNNFASETDDDYGV